MTSQPDASTRKTLLRFRIASAGEPIYRARARVGEVARRMGFCGEAVDEILLAFSEALANAIIHGCRDNRARVYVKAVQQDSNFILEIADHGRGFRPDSVNLPPSESLQEGGRGLFLMRAFMDDVQWLASPDGTIVRLTRRFPSLPCHPESADYPPVSHQPA